MFCKLVALFAVLAVAFAAPKPNPQLLTYSTGLDYVYPAAYAGSVPSVISPYSAAYTSYSYPAYPANAFFVR